MSGLPGGARLFSRMLARRVPYSGGTGAVVRLLEPGRAIVEMADRRRVRNHLGSVHAVALVNLGELASGLALLTALRPGIRGIVVGIEAEYLRKARGPLISDCFAAPPEVDDEMEHTVEAPIIDQEGELVCRVSARWLLRRS